jgi:hypothetical protein
MDSVAATLILAIGVVISGIGLYARVRNVALAGLGNVLIALLLFPQAGFGWRHYVSLIVLAGSGFVIGKSFDRAVWRNIRVEVILGLAIIANLWTSELLGARAPRDLRLGLLGLLALLTTIWIVLVLVRVTKEDLGPAVKGGGTSKG